MTEGINPNAGEQLVKQDLITREDLDEAKKRSEESGTAWYKHLVQMGKITFDAAEDVLRYEIHFNPKRRARQQTLGNELVKAGMLTEKKLKEALAEQKRSGRLLGNILVERGFVSRDDIARVLSKQHDIEFAPAADMPSKAQALAAVPLNIALKYQVIPVDIEGDKLTLLITNPQTQNQLEAIGVLLNKRPAAILTAVENLEYEIRSRYDAIKVDNDDPHTTTDDRQTATQSAATEEPGTGTPSEKESATVGEDTVSATEESESARFDQIAKQASGSSVVKMVSTIIEGAVNSGATDIHLDPQDPELRVRYRIDGILHDIMSVPENIQAAVVSRIKIISDLDITETRHPQDGHISMEIGGSEFDVRVASLPTFLGERVVLRLLDQTSVLSGISDLGLETEDAKKLTKLIDQPYGMILVTGPTGSGKTTTLYAALNQKNVLTDSIVTLEDPVEYQLSGINQVQIDTDIGNTFANILRASLRQDIDVLLVGEIRDQETARIAIRAAMTGHLVFSTLHTNDAPEAVSTLRNMGVPSFLISSALTGIVGQRLVRTICPKCRTPITPTPALLKSIGMPASVKKLYRGKGCDNCYHTGNRGRTGIFEVLEISPKMRTLIAEDAPIEAIGKVSKLKTMAARCRQKVKSGSVNPEEFLRVIRT